MLAKFVTLFLSIFLQLVLFGQDSIVISPSKIVFDTVFVCKSNYAEMQKMNRDVNYLLGIKSETIALEIKNIASKPLVIAGVWWPCNWCPVDNPTCPFVIYPSKTDTILVYCDVYKNFEKELRLETNFGDRFIPIKAYYIIKE